MATDGVGRMVAPCISNDLLWPSCYLLNINQVAVRYVLYIVIYGSIFTAQWENSSCWKWPIWGLRPISVQLCPGGKPQNLGIAMPSHPRWKLLDQGAGTTRQGKQSGASCRIWSGRAVKGQWQWRTRNDLSGIYDVAVLPLPLPRMHSDSRGGNDKAHEPVPEQGLSPHQVGCAALSPCRVHSLNWY